MGSPARAGIDPLSHLADSSSIRFPRTGGDRPDSYRVMLWSKEVPPHGRG